MKKKNKNNKNTQQNYNHKDKTNKKETNKYDSWKTWNTKKEEPYVYKGKKNQTEFPDFIDLCKATQNQLKTILPIKLLNAGYRDLIVDKGYIYAKGDIPVLLTAHLDTVHREPVKDFYEYINEYKDHIISSPQGIGGDDRCGVYMILQIIKEFKPYILFCEDEESGGIGSSEFCKTEFIKELSDMNFLIELDRANRDDAVFYDCDNPEFTKFIEKTTGFKEAWGTFSDISYLAPACGIAAVNLSCGYYHAHTLREEVNVEEMLYTIEMVKKLLTTESNQFEYIEDDFYKYESYSYHRGIYKKEEYEVITKDNWYDYYDSYEEMLLYNMDETEIELEDKIKLFVYFYGKNFSEEYQCVAGKTEDEAWGKFFKKYPYVCYNDVLDYEMEKIL